MQKYIVEPGDYLSLIANRFNIADWRTIYDHPENRSFRKKRPDPNVIKPNDVIFIPDIEPKTVTGSTDQKHRFISKVRPPLSIEILLRDEDHKPLGGADWTLIGENLELHGRTEEDGSMTAVVPHGTKKMELILDEMEWMRWQLDVGGLDPVDDDGETFLPGVQARLNNLGFGCGKVDGDMGPLTCAALSDFQRIILEKETPTGKIDSETLDRLVKEHGS